MILHWTEGKKYRPFKRECLLTTDGIHGHYEINFQEDVGEYVGYFVSWMLQVDDFSYNSIEVCRNESLAKVKHECKAHFTLAKIMI